MRYIVFFITCFMGSIISLPIMLTCKILKKEDEFHYIFLGPFFSFLLKVLNVQVNIHGNDKVKEKFTHTMVIANHTSLFDIVLLSSKMKSRMIYVSKEENKKIPIISWWMMMNKTIFIKRDNLKQTLKEMMKSSEYLLQGDNMMIFPQGTRNLEKIEFKQGTIKFAKKGKADIWPIAIKGPNEIFQGLGYKKKYIDMYALDIIKYDDYKDMNLNELNDMIEEQIRERVFNG